MRRRDQLRDAVLIDELSLSAIGELNVAAVLNRKIEGLGTYELAAKFVASNLFDSEKFIGGDYRLRQTRAAFTEIHQICVSIDAEKIYIFDEAKQNTSTIFENKIKDLRQIAKERKFPYTPITSYISQIFDYEAEHKVYDYKALICIKDVSLINNNIIKAIWRIKNSWYYILVDKRLILSFAAAAILWIPFWYLLKSDESNLMIGAQVAHDNFANDLNEIKKLLSSNNSSIFGRIYNAVRFMVDAGLLMPLFMAIPTTILSFLRLTMKRKSRALDRYEALFNHIGKELQKISPSRPPFISLRLKMTNTVIGIGKDIHQNVDSIINNSYNKVKGDYDSSVTKFLEEVGEKVKASKKKDAAEHYSGMIDYLKDNKISLAKSLWSGLKIIVPGVKEISGYIEIVKKLFPDDDEKDIEEV
ncbi:hypothetical protein [Methylobacterium terrae]|uniref:hypothetical protein n=1 Tax=Methylobacterium terrae TaxID=2202827 RepID=UPI0013A58766|nr:hypothetical protein [Methylobacterium terrae]